MTAQQMSKVWAVVGLLLLYYALNTYLVTQGGNTMFSATLISTRRIPAATLAIPICAFLLLLCSLIGIDFARKNGPRWSDRIPLVGFEQIDMTTREAKLYQAILLSVFSLVPIVSLIHFWQLFWSADVATTSNPTEPIPGGIWNWCALTSLNDPARICTSLNRTPGPSGQTLYSCDDNITILPGLEPALFALVTCAALGATLYFWWIVFRPRPGASAPVPSA